MKTKLLNFVLAVALCIAVIFIIFGNPIDKIKGFSLPEVNPPAKQAKNKKAGGKHKQIRKKNQ